MQTSAQGSPAAVETPRNCRKHTPATRLIQQRLERWELQHLRDLAAQLAEDNESLQRALHWAEDSAEMWQRMHHSLSQHFDNNTEDARCIGMTMSGEMLVVRTGEAA